MDASLVVIFCRSSIYLVANDQIYYGIATVISGRGSRLLQGVVDISMIHVPGLIVINPYPQRDLQPAFCCFIHIPLVTVLGRVGADMSKSAGDDRHVGIDPTLGDPGAIVAPMVWRIAHPEEGH